MLSSRSSKILPQNWNTENTILQSLYWSLVVLHLMMLYRISSQIDELMVAGLFWYVFFKRLQAHQQTEINRTKILSSLISFILISCILTRSLSFYWFDPTYVNAMPFLIVLAVSLLKSSWYIRKFTVELLFCLTLLIPLNILNTLVKQSIGIPLQILTAKISSFVLYYLGLSVANQGTVIRLPQGAVNVKLECTVYAVIFSLFQIWVLLVLMLPLRRRVAGAIFAFTCLVAQIVSVFRVALLAYVVDQPDLFQFWHDDQGQQLISTGLILFLGLTYYVFYWKQLDSEHEQQVEA